MQLDPLGYQFHMQRLMIVHGGILINIGDSDKRRKNKINTICWPRKMTETPDSNPFSTHLKHSTFWPFTKEQM